MVCKGSYALRPVCLIWSAPVAPWASNGRSPGRVLSVMARQTRLPARLEGRTVNQIVRSPRIAEELFDDRIDQLRMRNWRHVTGPFDFHGPHLWQRSCEQTRDSTSRVS